MTRQITTLILLLIICTQTNCRKYPKRGEIENRGEIVDNFLQPDCYYIKTYNSNEECIVKSMADFDIIPNSTCGPGAINIDFNSHSIIGKWISGGCDLKVIRELKIDHAAKQYIYNIKFKDVGMCYRMVSQPNLVIVPKIPSDYSVVFNVHED